ncbi:hypothetical protein BDY19DRAFT_928063 [Irpex rosettiformis]|uniref:Uncharacterized protein n=1 Tax=Irpex rosettiformis TaxID=378272 RepID=A0ACB8UCN5_9APHY|nr:hypothetical protein BDY19DRAFT_928063 [Irpex rosettiformis]
MSVAYTLHTQKLLFQFVSQDEQLAQQKATLVGGTKGFLGGAAVALPVSYIAHRTWPYYRALPPSLKAFGVILVVVPSFVISADHAGQKFEQAHWSDVGKQELDAEQARRQARWDSMTFRQKVGDFASRHEYGLIVGGWAACLAGSFGIIMRNKYQTMPQKIVQARMWAQGLTVGVLVVAGIMTHARRAKEIDEGPVRHIKADHSWQDILDAEDQARRNAQARFKADATVHLKPSA